MEKIDLHLHTTYSDGDLDITTLLLEAKKEVLKPLQLQIMKQLLDLMVIKKQLKNMA